MNSDAFTRLYATDLAIAGRFERWARGARLAARAHYAAGREACALRVYARAEYLLDRAGAVYDRLEQYLSEYQEVDCEEGAADRETMPEVQAGAPVDRGVLATPQRPARPVPQPLRTLQSQATVHGDTTYNPYA